MSSIYNSLSEERKKGQVDGIYPDWLTTGGLQVLNKGYFYEDRSLKTVYSRIAKVAASHLPIEFQPYFEENFFDIMWKGWLAPSTPMYNMGTPKGCPVSCSGGYIEDSIFGFNDSCLEAAMLTKNGFGTSGYLGDIRPRGASISAGGKASGVLPVIKKFVQEMRDVSQGGVRRGAWAGYLPAEHDDFNEVSSYLEMYPDDLNVGWNIHDSYIKALNNFDSEAHRRFQRFMKIKAVTGKGYFLFPDKINRSNPEAYKQNNLTVKASNLCTEIALFSDENHTFTCVLASMNVAKYDEWEDTNAVFFATILLDCVASEFIKVGSEIRGLEKAVRSTEKGRALGLGTLGFHSYLQQNMMPFESMETYIFNRKLFSSIKSEARRASEYLASILGEPEWCKGLGVRNTHLLAVAPNSSSALICGGVSQGIEPLVANVYNQPTAAGEISRLNPTLINLLKSKGVEITPKLIESITDEKGSVKNLNILTEEEKLVFKTAYEINQKSLIRLASSRQPDICQAQSLNLFFDADEDEGYIAEVHQEAFEDENIKALYYMRTAAGVSASKGACVSCEA